MSKIGRRPIKLDGVQIDIKGQDVHYKGKNQSGVYVLPAFLMAKVEDDNLSILPKEGEKKQNNMWGMHRALIANALLGAQKDFEQLVEIKGLGYKGQLSGNKITFSLGYSHKITLDLPKDIKLTIDKTGQKLAFSSYDKEKLGHVCALVRSFRPPEPYKGTGIRLAQEVVRRKAGKTKGSE